MQVKVIRPNAELGVVAHMAGVVKVNPSGTLKELRQDINRSLPGYLGSARYLFISRKFKIIDPRTEYQLIVSGVYKKTIYVKVFHGAGEPFMYLNYSICAYKNEQLLTFVVSNIQMKGRVKSKRFTPLVRLIPKVILISVLKNPGGSRNN